MRGPLISLAAACSIAFGHAAALMAREPFAPNCNAPAPSCAVPPNCYRPCDVPCGPKEGPKEGPPQPKEGPPTGEGGELAETGVYVAPPRVGTMQAPTRRVGIEGLSITFPELKVCLPRIHLPHCIHSYSDARMVIEEAHAPYVRTGYQYSAPAQAPASREAPRESCEEQLRAMQEKYDALERKAAQLERLIEQQRGITPQPGGCPPPMSPLQAPTPTADPAAYKVSVRLHPSAAATPYLSNSAAGVYPNRAVSYLTEPATLPHPNQPQPIREPQRATQGLRPGW
jgi:hypothetical protein